MPSATGSVQEPKQHWDKLIATPGNDMTNASNRRQISGHRVIVNCSLELPKIDPFSPMKADRDGFIILNVRGCSLYLGQQFSDISIKTVFPDNKPRLIKRLTLNPTDGNPITIGNIHARFLHFNDVKPLPGMVLRFVDVSEDQMQLLNDIQDILPRFIGAEEDVVPWQELQKAG